MNNMKQQFLQTEDLVVYSNQVSGKTPKYVGKDQSIIYKFYSEGQYKFYTHVEKLSINDFGYCLKKFLPIYRGVIRCRIKNQSNNNIEKNEKQKWIEMILSRTYEQNMKFIKLNNFTYSFKFANLLDIKLGTKRDKPSNIKFKHSTTNEKKFRMNGMCLRQMKQNSQYHDYFINKYYGQTVEQSDIQVNLAFFFYSKNEINKKLVMSFCNQLGELLISLQSFPRIRFMSASIIFSYDAYNTQKFVLKLIDFDKCQQLRQDETADFNIIQGVANIQNYLRRIIENIKSHQSMIQQKKLRLFSWDEQATKEQIKKKKINKEQMS